MLLTVSALATAEYMSCWKAEWDERRQGLCS